MLLGYFLLLRRSEFLVIGRGRHAYCLKTTNAFYSDKRGIPVARGKATPVTIGLKGAKNDQYGRGAWRTMHTSGDSQLCPILALDHIFQARAAMDNDAGQFLCGATSAEAVTKALKRMATLIGGPLANYSTHSIRIGGANALMNGAADSLSIRLFGRWMSNCFEEYPVQAAKATVQLSQKMV